MPWPKAKPSGRSSQARRMARSSCVVACPRMLWPRAASPSTARNVAAFPSARPSLSNGDIFATLARLKPEEPAFPKPKLTWGDVAFGLEVARWELRRFFNRYELLRRLLGLRREPDSTTPGLLLIKLRGVSFEEI